MKTITIIDAFVDRDRQQELLINFLNRVKSVDPILLITNSVLDKSIADRVDYLFYDKSNTLFEGQYLNYEKFYLWSVVNHMRLTTCHVHKQKHGLSVLINLFRSLKLAKDLGYTHFRRIEYDTLIGERTLQDFIDTPLACEAAGKRAKFYINESAKVNSFQYFFSEIDFFLDNFPEIKNEQDYSDLLNREYGNQDFVTVEKLMYHYISKLDKDQIYIENDLAEVLNDTVWNQSSSNSHLPESMHECSTDVYKYGDQTILFSLNRKNSTLRRKVKVYGDFSNYEIFEHTFTIDGEWTFNEIRGGVSKFEVYDNDLLVFSKSVDQIENYIELYP